MNAPVGGRRRWLRRHPDDRDILILAVPALGALAADPLYSLADTAFVGHLGAVPLAAVAIGTAAFNASFWLFSFLEYGVTARVARAVGAEDADTAARLGVQALILAALLGGLATLVGVAFAGPIVTVLGAEGRVADLAEPYLRIRALSSIPVQLVMVGHGWLRGDQDTRTPMIIVLAAGAANVVLDYVFIYVLGWGIEGAAWATVAGQLAAALVFLAILMKRMSHIPLRVDLAAMRSLLSVGFDLIARAGVMVAALTGATAIAARMGVISLGAWQVTMQVFNFLALSLDAVAIAAQAMIGKHLGAGAIERARDSAGRLMVWGVGFGVILLGGLFAARVPVAGLFSSDERVVTASAGLLAWLALVQPLGAAAFTLDGILIGASDTRFLALWMTAASAAFVGGGVVALNLGWGTAGLAGAMTLWLALRTTALSVRLASGRWALQP